MCPRRGTSTAKIVSSSSLLPLMGAPGFCWGGKQRGVTPRNKAEICKNAFKSPDLDLMRQNQTKSLMAPIISSGSAVGHGNVLVLPILPGMRWEVC